jgi:hypothetical protein
MSRFKDVARMGSSSVSCGNEASATSRLASAAVSLPTLANTALTARSRVSLTGCNHREK